jgi:peptidyl-prolyl cis-trans isomerase C
MLFAWSRRRSLLRQAVALLAIWTLSAGVAWAQQSHPATTHAKPADTKPAADAAKPASATPASTTPPAPTKPAESAMRPGEDILRPPSDPVVAIVEGHMIYLSDVGRAVPQLPENLRGLPFQTLFPVVLDRLIDHQALVQLALREHLDNDPVVRRQIQDAADRILEGALLSRVATPQATEDAIQAQYTKQYVGKPATEEVRARHILVSTEQEAKDLIARLNKGADFPSLAKQDSKDPDGKNGGDLGFFRRDQVWPEFSDVAFALQPGQISQTPIHNEFGWHVVKVEERRIVAPPTYSEVHDALRQELLQDAVQREIDQARTELAIHKFNIDGSPMGKVSDISPAQPMVKPPEQPKP